MPSHTDLPLEPLDVLIMGAGVSGIGAAAYLRRDQPHKVIAILESREQMGGTWDLFRYPGIRSDSDLYTFGFDFKPWTKAKSLADASDILEYLHETIDEYALAPFIHYKQQVISANWQTDKGLWAVQVEDGYTAKIRVIECRWLFSAGGYYRYDQGSVLVLKAVSISRGKSFTHNTGQNSWITPASESSSLAVVQRR